MRHPIFLIVTLILLCGTAAVAIPVEQGLVGYWPAEGTANDDSGNNYHGTLVNGATFGPGIDGQAFHLDGVDDHVSLPLLAGLGDFSMVAWFKPDSTGQPIDVLLVFQTGMGQMFMDPIDGDAAFVVFPSRQGRSDPGERGYFLRLPNTVSDNEWHHLAMTATAQNVITTYLDGQFLGLASYGFTGYGANHNFARIGVNSFQGGGGGIVVEQLHFNGLIDEVAVYDRALADEEIEELYAVGTDEPPTADAGPDQSIHAGTVVDLDGGGSFDDNTPTAELDFAWVLIPPASSTAALDDETSATPSFFVDVPGTYFAELTVADERGQQSPTDTVSVSSTNLAPTADAGLDQAAVVGDGVDLDGSGSADPESDPLDYDWRFSGRPQGSAATLTDADTVSASFVPDLSGSYTLRLVVNDGFVDSMPDEVSVLVITPEEHAANLVVEASNLIRDLPRSSLTTVGNQRALLNFLRQAIEAIQAGDVAHASSKLTMAIGRTDGCAQRGAPDGNGPGRDWITTCMDQLPIYDLLTEARDSIE